MYLERGRIYGKEKIAEMNEASRRLDFELAALLRDEIVVLKEELKQK